VSTLFGGGTNTVAKTPTRAMGIDMQGAQYGNPVPVVFGQNKVAGNVIWYGDFQATAHQQSQGGGKGGGGQTSTSYTYSASFELGLCEGVASIVNVYQGSSTVSLSRSGGIGFTGTQGQAAWSHLSGAAALGYSGTAIAAFQNLQLGSSASLPNFNFEVAARNQFGGGVVDALPSDILTAICTDSQIGINFTALGDLTQFKDYCAAAGIFFSPVYTTQQSASQTLDDLFKYSNSAAWFSEGVLKVQPYGDTSLTGNGYTYTPNVTPIVNLGPGDFITNGADDPVTIKRTAPADAMNIVRVEYKDRANTYHGAGVVASIDQDVVTTGARADQSESVDMITQASVARLVAQNLLQRIYYVRNTYEFQLPWRYCYLEPMDVVTLTDANTGLYLAAVRITEVSEDEHGLLAVTAEEFPEGIGHAAIYGTQPNAGTTVDPNSDPGAVTAPYLFRGPGFLVSNSQPEIWCALAATNPLWAGCDVFISRDGTSYTYLATTTRQARYGIITNSLPSAADPDTTSAPVVALETDVQLLGGSQADADAFVTLSMVDTEIVSYETATLGAGPTYTLGYLRRGGYGSAIAAHAANAPFVRLDDNILRIPVDPSEIGQVIYLKFHSFNCFGRTPRTLAEETAYQYTVGSNVELPDVPLTPASFATAGIADGVSITWTNTSPAAVGCTSIERSTASTGPWTVIAQVGPTTNNYADHFTNGATYYYRARARGPLVQSGWSAYTSVFNSTGTNVTAIGNTANQALSDAETALTNAANALSAADGKAEITVGTAAPSSPKAGDIWYDTSTSPDAAYVWNGSAWAPADSAAQAQAATAASAASAASTLAGTKAEVTIGTTAPASPHTGDIWYDTAVSPEAAYAWNGAAWVSLDSYAQSLANSAQSTANAANANQPAVVNPQFYNGLASWSGAGDPGWVAQTDGSNLPDPIVNTAAVHDASISGAVTTSVLRNNAHVPVVTGQQVIVTCCVKEAGVNAGALGFARISWRDASNNEIATSVPDGSVQYPTCGAAGTGTYTNCVTKVIGQAPTGAKFAVAECEVSGHTAGQFLFSNVCVTVQPASLAEVPDASGRYAVVNGAGLNAVSSVDGGNRALIDFSQGGHFNKQLDNIGDGTTYYRMPAANMDGSRRALIDFTQAGHVSKNLDNIGDGSTYGRTKAAGLQSGIVTNVAYGANSVPNPNFATNLVGALSGVIAGGADICDGWVAGAASPYFEILREAAAPADILIRIPSGTVLPASLVNSQVSAGTKATFAVTPSKVYRLFALGSCDNNALAPAGVTFFYRTRIAWIDSAQAFISESYVDGNAYGSFTVDADVTAPATAAQAYFNLEVFVSNSNATAVTISGFIADTRWNAVSLTAVNSLDRDVQDGSTYARIYGSELSSGQHRIGVAGSGYRIGDQRNLTAVTFSNYGSGWNGLSLSYSATTTSATITASAATLQAGSVAINYNASSVTVSGSAGTTVTYYLYYQDPANAGGAQTLYATTSQITALSNDGNMAVATISVTFPASGTGSGGGGGYCPLRTAWVIRRGRHGRSQHVRAGKVRVGDWLLRSDGQWAEVTFSRPELQPCVRLVADGFGTLGCSISAPMQLRDGRALARDCLDREVVAQLHGKRAHALVNDLRGLEHQWVQHITLANAPDDFYLVGDSKDCLFAHHNMKP
jgi:hypothetical protein